MADRSCLCACMPLGRFGRVTRVFALFSLCHVEQCCIILSLIVCASGIFFIAIIHFLCPTQYVIWLVEGRNGFATQQPNIVSHNYTIHYLSEIMTKCLQRQYLVRLELLCFSSRKKSVLRPDKYWHVSCVSPPLQVLLDPVFSVSIPEDFWKLGTFWVASLKYRRVLKALRTMNWVTCFFWKCQCLTARWRTIKNLIFNCIPCLQYWLSLQLQPFETEDVFLLRLWQPQLSWWPCPEHVTGSWNTWAGSSR